MTATSSELRFDASADTEELLGRVEYVVADHLERFGKRDNLKVTWTR